MFTANFRAFKGHFLSNCVSVLMSVFVCVCQSVEERRTVRDGQGNEETTVTRSEGSGISEGPDHPSGPVLPGQLLYLSTVCVFELFIF